MNLMSVYTLFFPAEDDTVGDNYRMRQFQSSMNTDERHVLHSTSKYFV